MEALREALEHILKDFGSKYGSGPILVTSGEAWYLSHFNTEETRTAMP